MHNVQVSVYYLLPLENVIFSVAHSDIQTVARLSSVWAIAME